MRKFVFALCCIASTSAIALDVPTDADSNAIVSRPAERDVRVAQACGWYAIFHCSRSAGDAQRWSNRHVGYVIDTSSATYPNFASGWYCVVEGPMNHSSAVVLAQRWRSSGVSPTAYAKNAC